RCMSSVQASPEGTPSSPSTAGSAPSPRDRSRRPTARSMAPLQAPPRVPWLTLQAKLERQWQPGEHVTIVAPTGHGKTHLALTLAELCRYVLVLATKRKDPLVAELAAKGYLVTARTDEILWTETEPVNTRVVIWPQFGDKVGARQRLVLQADALREVLDWADKT